MRAFFTYCLVLNVVQKRQQRDMGHLKLFMADTCHALKPPLSDTNTNIRFIFHDARKTQHTFKLDLNA